MLFNSYIFILCFLPLCILGYFALNHMGKTALAQVFLLGMSFWFYGYFNPSYLVIMLGSIFLNYGFARIMNATVNARWKKLELLAIILANIGILFYFKYYDFFASNINGWFGTDFRLLHVVLPLGISFFTFQQISYVVDAYRGEVDKYSFVQYASFVAYFPQLIAGPIVTHDELIPQFADMDKKRFNWDNFAAGTYMFLLGLAKKVLIADVFGNAANWGFGNIGDLDSTNAILTVLSYTVQVYFDFSGYCDMAIGIGKMMNIDLPVNFDSPYKAKTILEFWDRWHKTLTRFFTKYVYIPLGGNRKGKLCTYRNIMIVYLISGLWHGANWTFLLWGILHGVASVAARHWKNRIARLPAWLNWTLTFLFLNVTWVFFRANSISDGVQLLLRIAMWDFGPTSVGIKSAFNVTEIVFPVLWLVGVDLNLVYSWALSALAMVGALVCVTAMPNSYHVMKRFRGTWWELLAAVFLLVWCIFSLSGVSTFLYFNF